MTKIFLDVDGVFANFSKATIAITGAQYHTKLSSEIWKELSRQYRLFWHLELIPDSLRIITMLQHHDLEFLTALPEPTGGLVTADEDKRAWIAHHISRSIPVNTIEGGKNKPVYLQKYPGAVLIDDFERNINLWNDAGGVGILHTDTPSTILKLEELNLI